MSAEKTHLDGDLIVNRAVAPISVNGVVNASAVQAATGANLLETTLWQYVLPAGALDTDGRGIRIVAALGMAANANNKQIRLYFGSTLLFDTGALSVNGSPLRFDATVVRRSASAQVGSAAAWWASGYDSKLVFPAESATGAITIKITGQNGTAVANDIVFHAAVVELF